jgi:hypothetical protein
MNGAKIRRWVLIAATALAAASMFPSFGGGSSKPHTSAASGHAAVGVGYVHKLPAPTGEDRSRQTSAANR